jgi:hypothetical protein
MVSRRARIAKEQETHDVKFSWQPESQGKNFEDVFTAIYGVPGIGKSKFTEVLSYELMRKHNLGAPAAYFIQCEPINHPWKIRHTYIPTWPTFRDFVDKVEKDTKFQSTVKLWIIDTIDGLIPKGISTICNDFEIVDPRDEGWAAAWREMTAELVHQLLRLQSMAGVLILSHERDRKATFGRYVVERPSMDLSNSVNNIVGDLCSMVLHMRNAAEEEGDGYRVLASIGTQAEDAKDNLNVILPRHKDGIIKFKTEEEAVSKLLDCFSGKGGVTKHKKVKKVKKVKKKKKSKKAKRR